MMRCSRPIQRPAFLFLEDGTTLSYDILLRVPLVLPIARIVPVLDTDP
jgi:hypothetical protein